MSVDLIPENLYRDFLEKGYITQVRYLNVLGYKTSFKQHLGWVGWDYKKEENRYRVRRLANKHMISFVHAQYLGEAFVRFVTLRTRKETFGTGVAYNYVVAHYVPTDKGLEERLIYWGPRGSMRGKVERMLSDYQITEENCQEFMIRLWRDDFGKQPYECSIYFHDIDLPSIDKDDYISYDKRGMMHLKQVPTGNVSQLFEPYNGKTTHGRVWKTDEEKTIAEMLIKTHIPFQRHRPDKDMYVEWFMRYLHEEYDKAEKLYKRRWEVRLP